VQQLIDADAEEVEKVGINARNSAAYTLRENCIDCSAVTQHSIHQLAQPAPVARVELDGFSFE
jgi:hypothetical protein